MLILENALYTLVNTRALSPDSVASVRINVGATVGSSGSVPLWDREKWRWGKPGHLVGRIDP